MRSSRQEYDGIQQAGWAWDPAGRDTIRLSMLGDSIGTRVSHSLRGAEQHHSDPKDSVRIPATGFASHGVGSDPTPLTRRSVSSKLASSPVTTIRPHAATVKVDAMPQLRVVLERLGRRVEEDAKRVLLTRDAAASVHAQPAIRDHAIGGVGC